MTKRDYPPPKLTALDMEVLRALGAPNTRLRWHANRHPDRRLAGRGQVMGEGRNVHGEHFTGGPLASYSVRRLVEGRHLQPIDVFNAKPFSMGGPPYRDYCLSEAKPCKS